MVEEMMTNETRDWEDDESSSDKIIDPFDPTKIDISLKQMIIESFIRRLKENEIDLKTKFQRRAGLWNEVQQSRLIESMLIRMPLPAFYFDGTDDNNWLIVDGLQRLTSLNNFVLKKNLRLIGLEYLQQFEGFSYDELPRSMQRRIEETQVVAYIINPGTPPDVKFNIFKRINTGGLTLEPQEIRHALYQGKPAQFLEDLAQLPEFLEATCNSIKIERMEDRHYVLRFLAFSMIGYENYKSFADLDKFLNEAMELLRKKTDDEREQLKEKFRKSMRAATSIFGEDAFRKRHSLDDRRNPLNKALFEAWSVNLGELDDEQIKRLVERKHQVRKAFVGLMNYSDFNQSVSTGTGGVRSVNLRFWGVNNLIQGVLS